MAGSEAAEQMTIVFELASRAASSGVSLARDLIATHHAEKILDERDVQALDEGESELRNFYVVDGGDEYQTRELLESLYSDSAVNLAYVSPPRSVMAAVSVEATVDDWRDQIQFARATALPQWKGPHRVSVAMVDSGCDINHPQLTGVTFVDHFRRNPLPKVPDAMAHGTHVAGLIAAAHSSQNGFGGLAADVVDLEVHRGIRRPSEKTAYYRAIRAARSSQILNLSLGGEGEDPFETRVISQAIKKGIIVVAAMGNSGEMGDPTHYPAAVPGVIAIGAVNRHGAKASFSNAGEHIFISAPGVDIWSTAPIYPVKNVNVEFTPPLCVLSGTSMATPIVTAVIAKMLSWNPAFTPAMIKDLLVGQGGYVGNPDIGRGCIDVFETLRSL